MRRFIAASLFITLALTSCTPFVQSDGSIAFDISIRINAPMASPTPSPTRAFSTPVPTIAPTDDPTPTIEFATSQPPGWGRVTTTKLNVRSAPGVDNSIVGYLFLGNVVFIIERNEAGTWLQVEDEAGVLMGWVSAQYVEEYRG